MTNIICLLFTQHAILSTQYTQQHHSGLKPYDDQTNEADFSG